MFKLLVDTCVWLDVAKDPHQHGVLAAVEELVKLGEVSLIVPRVVLDEFARNRTRIEDESTRSLQGVFKRVREAVNKFGDPRKKRAALTQLEDVSHKIPILGGAAKDALDRIQRLLDGGTIVATSDDLLVRASRRALDGKAPFHRNRNQIGDAIIIETYASMVAQKASKTRFGFVTHNTADFSHPTGDKRTAHPDLAPLFTKVRSLYFVQIADALRRASPGLIDDILFEHDFIEEPRPITEITALINELWDKVWYNRHQVYRQKIEAGLIKVVEKETFPLKDHAKRPIQRDVWELAQQAAKRKEKKYGVENLGPWDDFEWGMISGKLSALRWVLGEDWETTLDT